MRRGEEEEGHERGISSGEESCDVGAAFLARKESPAFITWALTVIAAFLDRKVPPALATRIPTDATLLDHSTWWILDTS